MTSRLSLTVLVDNTTLTDHYLTAEPGLSFLIQTLTYDPNTLAQTSGARLQQGLCKFNCDSGQNELHVT